MQTVKNAVAAIEFYREAFEAVEQASRRTATTLRSRSLMRWAS
jgi:uncharacterized glyoxalase superfamily protein PhnB